MEHKTRLENWEAANNATEVWVVTEDGDFVSIGDEDGEPIVNDAGEEMTPEDWGGEPAIMWEVQTEWDWAAENQYG